MVAPKIKILGWAAILPSLSSKILEYDHNPADEPFESCLAFVNRADRRYRKNVVDQPAVLPDRQKHTFPFLTKVVLLREGTAS